MGVNAACQLVSFASPCPFTWVSVDPEPMPRKFGEVPAISEPSVGSVVAPIFCGLFHREVLGKLLITSPTFVTLIVRVGLRDLYNATRGRTANVRTGTTISESPSFLALSSYSNSYSSSLVYAKARRPDPPEPKRIPPEVFFFHSFFVLTSSARSRRARSE